MICCGPKQPNIIVILADDMGYGDLSCYNRESRIQTPNMDSLAREGVSFTDAHSATACSTPSRYGLLTGRYCWRTPLQQLTFFNYERPLIEPDRLTLASLLKRHGYATACFGKWHVGLNYQVKPGAKVNLDSPWPWYNGPLPDRAVSESIDFSKPVTGGPLELGFDTAFYTSGCSTDQEPFCFIDGDRCLDMEGAVYRNPAGSWRSGMTAPGWVNETVDIEFTRRAVRYIQDRHTTDPENPFFLYLALSSPHSPHLSPEMVRGESDAGARGDLVCLVDWSVGEIAQTLDRFDLREDTLLIVTSDNGPLIGSQDPDPPEKKVGVTNGHLSAGNYRGYKAMIYEGGHREPLIARWPRRIKAGTKTNELVCLTDFMATVAALVGTELPEDAGEDSVNILPSFLGEKRGRPLRDSIIHQSNHGVYSLRRDRWKMIFQTKGNGRAAGPEPGSDGQLYDMADDPYETRDLWDEKPRIVEELCDLLAKQRGADRST
ncbi:MAG: arylsulfatase [Spirochaetales bacterium]|nr:arylsulfatase [Spirochaetales bacterium]